MQRYLIFALALDFLFCQPSKRPPFDQIELELPGGTKVGSGSLFLIYSLTKQGQGRRICCFFLIMFCSWSVRLEKWNWLAAQMPLILKVNFVISHKVHWNWSKWANKADYPKLSALKVGQWPHHCFYSTPHRGRVYKWKFCLSICPFVCHHFLFFSFSFRL